jgi:hypothetical protein
MNTPKTTSIDWLREKIQSNLSEPMSPKFAELFEQARDMEREQIEQAYNQADINGLGKSYGHGKLYYNETYGKSE